MPGSKSWRGTGVLSKPKPMKSTRDSNAEGLSPSGQYRGAGTTLDGAAALWLRRAISLFGLLAFVLSLATCLTVGLGKVTPWMDYRGNVGILQLGIFSICKEGFVAPLGSPPLSDDDASGCVSYNIDEGYYLLTNFYGHHNRTWNGFIASAECDEDNNFFARNADGEVTDFCHARNTVAVFFTLGTILSFFAMLFAFYIAGQDKTEAEYTTFALYCIILFCDVLSYGVWTSFLDKWGDAEVGNPVGRIMIDRSLSIELMLATWIVVVILFFLTLAKLNLFRHIDDDQDREQKNKVKVPKFNPAKHRDQDMFIETQNTKLLVDKLALEVDELLLEADPSVQPESSSDEEEEEALAVPVVSPIMMAPQPMMMMTPQGPVMMGTPAMQMHTSYPQQMIMGGPQQRQTMQLSMPPTMAMQQPMQQSIQQQMQQPIQQTHYAAGQQAQFATGQQFQSQNMGGMPQHHMIQQQPQGTVYATSQI